MEKPESLEAAFETICKEVHDTFIKGYNDYGKENVLDTGELGIIYRVNDKLSKLKNLLTTRHEPETESVNQTWRDIANYAIIAIMLRNGWFQELDLKDKK